MGYYLYDVDGYVADGPSISGWEELVELVLMPQGGEATREFVQDGATERLKAFRSELRKMKAPTKHTATSLVALREAVGKAQEIVILSDGVSS